MPRNLTSLSTVVVALLISFAPALHAQTAETPAGTPKARTGNDFRVFTNLAGSGTNDKLAKWTNSGADLTDSAIYESGGKVGIGTTTPGSGLSGTQESPLHIFSSQDKNTILYLQNSTIGLNASATLKLQADTAGMSVISHSTGRTGTSRFGSTLANWNEVLAVSGNGLVVGTNFSSPLIFGTNAKSRVQIASDGYVSVGGTTPTALLHLYPSSVSTETKGINLKLYEYATLGTTYGGWSTVLGWNAAADQAQTNNMVTLLDTTSTTQWGASAIRMSNDGIVFHTKPGPTTAGATLNSQRFIIDGNGNVNFSTPATGTFVIGVPPTTGQPGVNVTINGTLTATKVIGAVYQDVAEWVPATTHMEAGTVVVLNRNHDNEVMPSHRPYDTAVAGVVSAQPGVILGVPSDSKAQIATTGRVKVHVDATAGAIEIGDLLVTSDKSGTAMKSQPIDLGGVPIHRPGTVIGKALQPLASGTGEILVLLSLQ